MAPALIFVTQVLDRDDPTLGFVVGWASALAVRSRRLVVIANEVRRIPADVPFEVETLGKERGSGRAQRALAYERILTRLFRGDRWSAVVAHMCPVYLTAAAPMAKAYSTPTYLWYAHPAYTLKLRIAEVLADGILTSLPGAYPGRDGSVHIIGQATDVLGVEPSPRRTGDATLRLLALGRTSPSKGFDHILRGFADATRRGLSATLRIVGPTITSEEASHRKELLKLVSDLGLTGRATVEPPVRSTDVPELLRSTDVLVNAMVDGSGDKVVFEAIAAGRIPVASNRCFLPVVGGLEQRLDFDRDSPLSLADRLIECAALSRSDYEAIAFRLRERVRTDHSLDSWAESVLRICGSDAPHP